MADQSIIASKIPPHSIEAEQSVLGSVLIDNKAAEEAFGLLQADHFYRHDHQILFQSIVTLLAQQKNVDVITLSEHLDRANQLKEAGGTAYIAELAQNTPTAANVLSYARIVRERALMRSLISAGTEVAKLGFEPGERQAHELTEEAEQLIFKLAQQQINASAFRPIASIMQQVTENIDRLSSIEGDITGVPTGFLELDKKTSGLQAGDLIILAGRPSMGKTTIAMNIVEQVSRFHLLPSNQPNGDPVSASVGVFSMEMSGEQIAMRLISSIGKIPLGNIRSGSLADNEWTNFFHAAQVINQMNLHIDDSSGLTAFELRSRARRLKRDNPHLSLIMVDYLQLLHGDGRSSENRVAEMTQISRLLKEMARELDLPVLVLSQLNRSVEKRGDHRPIMSDLRESGSIEQDADVIMFIHREEVYQKKPENAGHAQLIIGKQRNGETGDIKLRFNGKHSQFTNMMGMDMDAESPQWVPDEFRN